MHSSYFNESGFTLLELLIVCLLIGITLAFAVPSLRHSLVTDELAHGSRQIISLIKISRSRAVTENESFLIVYNPTKGILHSHPADSEDTTIYSTVTLPPDVRIHTIQQTDTNNTQERDVNTIWISRQGYMDRTVIQLVDRDDKKLSLLISAFLPSITVIEGAVDSENLLK